MDESHAVSKFNAVKKQATLLHSQEAIENAMSVLQTKLTNQYADKNPIFLVVMNGGLIFAGKILPLLNFPLQIDYCHATRYRGETTGGEIEWKAKPQMHLQNRHVVIVQ